MAMTHTGIFLNASRRFRAAALVAAAAAASIATAQPGVARPQQQPQLVRTDDPDARTDRDVIDAMGRIAGPMMRYESAVGLSLGIITPDGSRHILSLGMREAFRPGMSFEDLKTARPDSVYEIGSITKVFTSLLLVEMAERGELRLDDPVNDYLPDGVELGLGPTGLPITLAQLAQHTSGLPRLPANMGAAAQSIIQPYANYDNDDLWAAVDGFTTFQPGGDDDEQATTPRRRDIVFDYSNLGSALLGQALAQAAQQPYEQLVAERILQPLGMDSTRFQLDQALSERAASPHYLDFRTMGMWNFDAFAPAGALKSDADDILDFLQAFIEPTEIAPGDETSPLERAVRGVLRAPRVATDRSGVNAATLGWLSTRVPQINANIFWHNGQTGGSKAYAAVAPVVVLANYPDPAVDVLARHLLNYAVTGQVVRVPVREFIDLRPDDVEPLTGLYEFPDGRQLVITAENDRVFAQVRGQDRFRIYPERARVFFYKVVPARIAFVFDPETNLASELIFRQSGGQLTAKRVGDAPTPEEQAEQDQPIPQRGPDR